MRSLECWTSEPKRASLVRRWTSSVSAALSSASETSVASAVRLLCCGLAICWWPAIASRPWRSPRTDSGSSSVACEAGMRSSSSALADRRRGEGASSAAAVAGRDGPGGAQLGVGDDDAVALGEAEARDDLVARERAGGDERRAADVVAAGGGDEVGAGGAEDLLAGHRALLLAHEAGHAGDHEAEQDDRGDVDHELVVAVVDDLEQGHDRRDQRSEGEQDEPQRRQARVAVRGGRLELDHRRVQRGRAPQEVEAEPAEVEHDLAVVGARERDQAVGEVGREQGEDARHEQIERGPARAGVDGEPDRGGEQQDVADRVGDRDELGDGRELLVVQRRLDQRDPRDQREAERHDQRVDRPGAVALRVAAADEDQQPHHQGRVDEDVGRVAERRERHLRAGQARIAVGVEVAQPEQQEADREPAPRPGPGAAVAPDAETIAITGESPSRLKSGPLPANGGTHA